MKHARLVALFFFPFWATFAKEFITVSTGSVTGLYYPTGGALCALINQDKNNTQVRCSVESTGGSTYNLKALTHHATDLGIIQNDVIFEALEDTVQTDSKNKELRTLFHLYTESLTLVVKKNAGIHHLSDLKNKRVNVGNPGSGNRKTVEKLFEACGLKFSDLKEMSEQKVEHSPEQLKKNQLDAYFFMVGHPAANIVDASKTKNWSLIPIEGACVDELIQTHPYFVKSVIQKDTYETQNTPIPTLGVKAALMTTAKLSVQTAYYFTKRVFDQLETFKTLHPLYLDLTPQTMIENPQAPFHPGALKFFQEKKWIPVPVPGKLKK